jgi:hypothetical protein
MAAISAFSFPRLGKPDPKQDKPLGKDTRDRVVQNAKHNLCWYSAMNALRERYRAPNTAHLQERKFEQLVSGLAKKQK